MPHQPHIIDEIIENPTLGIELMRLIDTQAMFGPVYDKDLEAIGITKTWDQFKHEGGWLNIRVFLRGLYGRLNNHAAEVTWPMAVLTNNAERYFRNALKDHPSLKVECPVCKSVSGTPCNEIRAIPTRVFIDPHSARMIRYNGSIQCPCCKGAGFHEVIDRPENFDQWQCVCGGSGRILPHVIPLTCDKEFSKSLLRRD